MTVSSGESMDASFARKDARLETALAAIAEAARPTGRAAEDEATALIAAKCRAMIVGYHRVWGGAPWRAVEVESTIEAPLLNPNSGRASRKFKVAGKLDVVAVNTEDGRRMVIDHKTTSEEIEDADGPFWAEQRVGAQSSTYLLLKWIEGDKLDGALWDVMRKPTIGPRQIKSKAEVKEVLASRSYYGRALSEAAADHVAAQGSENLEMYEARLVHDCCQERPARYFQRRIVPRVDADLLDHAAALWDAGQVLLHLRRRKRACFAAQPERRWPQHTGNCMNYGRPCGYLGLCSKFDRPDSDRWQVKSQVHSELPLLPGDGRGTLTYSSVKTFQGCPRRYYYAYVLGIERRDEEEAEPLRFGTIWHLALEQFWRATMQAP